MVKCVSTLEVALGFLVELDMFSLVFTLKPMIEHSLSLKHVLPTGENVP